MEEKHIRAALPEELPRIMEIYAFARTFMAEHGNPNQWGPNKWPPEELIREDIAREKCHVCEVNGHIAAVFFYDYGFRVEPTYAEIDGSWRGGDEYGVVHRIASDGSVKGAGRFCLEWAYAQSGHHLRIDTHSDNHVMQSLLEKLHFEKCGVIYVHEDNAPRLAYERICLRNEL